MAEGNRTLLFFDAIGSQKLPFGVEVPQRGFRVFLQIATVLGKMVSNDQRNMYAKFHDDRYP
jgi:hypothetical protein